MIYRRCMVTVYEKPEDGTVSPCSAVTCKTAIGTSNRSLFGIPISTSLNTIPTSGT